MTTDRTAISWGTLFPLRRILLLVGISLSFVGVLFAFGWFTRSERLITSVNEVIDNQGRFQKSNLTDVREDIIWLNPNGDETLSGVFHLTSEQMAVLMQAEQPLHCPTGQACRLTKNQYPDRVFFEANVPGGVAYELIANTQTNEAYWSIAWY